MIYMNFLYFIVAIGMFSSGPIVPGKLFSTGQGILALVVILVWFWHFSRTKFANLKARYDSSDISSERARKTYSNLLNGHFLLSIALFATEIFVFDLKAIMNQFPLLGYSELLLNCAGLIIFLLHLAIGWYWGYRAMGDVLELGDSTDAYIRSNIKFNLPIVAPWLILLLFNDLLDILGINEALKLMELPFYQEIFFGLYIILFSLFGPLLIARLWDCNPLPPSPLLDSIEKYCRSQGVKFRGIMSWDALGKGLVTAGVMGIAGPFRYLMITPALMNLLDEDEIMAVVCHEVGHVKRRHHFLYLFFFFVFFLLMGNLMGWLVNLIVTPDRMLDLLTGGGSFNATLLNYGYIAIFILCLILYFRFIFGYFMRNFERQADAYCFESGLNPNHLVSSFMKLGMRLGDDSKKKNWHHFNIAQRIDFIRRGIENPEVVAKHHQKVNRGLAISLVIFISLFALLLMNPHAGGSANRFDLPGLAAAIEKRIEKNPGNPGLYSTLGDLYYELKEWQKSKQAYEYSVGLAKNQPAVLNNLAWLLLKAEDDSILDPRKALKLARQAVEMQETPQYVDTLAEALYQNHFYLDAYKAAKRALQIAQQNRYYFRKQYHKMKEAVKNRKPGAPKNPDEKDVNGDLGQKRL